MEVGILKNESAISPIFGVVILICLLSVTSIIVGSVLYVHYSEPRMPPMVNLDVSQGDGSSLKISHRGGDNLRFSEDVRVLVVAEEETYELDTPSLDHFDPGDDIEIDLVDNDGTPIANLSPGDTIIIKIIDSKETILLEEEVTLTHGSESDTEQDQDSEYNGSYVNDTILEELLNMSGTAVRFTNSDGIPLSGGVVTYYQGSWKEFGTTDINGLAINSLDNGTYTFRISYNYAYSELSQNITADAIVDFQTTLVNVSLFDSNSSIIDTNSSVVSYYSGGWRNFGTTSRGVAQKELFPGTYTFSMNYEYASLNKVQNITNDSDVLFQTTHVTVKLLDSHGSLMDANSSIVKYYSGGWRNFGTTSGGIVQKELFPGTYTFSMNYEYASLNKAQNIANDSDVLFQTTPVTVKLLDSSGSIMDTDSSTVSYYSGGWRNFGTTQDGIVQKELFPGTYTFSMNYEYASFNKAQNIANDSNVLFQTIPVTVKLLDSSGSIMDTDSSTVSYYSGGWRNFGTTQDGIVQKELLPNSYSFSMNYEYASFNKAQNIANDSDVFFQTTLVTVKLLDSSGSIMDTDSSIVKYYSGGWRDFGTTSGGIVQKELLPNSYTFSMSYEYASLEKAQNIANDRDVFFQTTHVTVKLLDSAGELIDTDSGLVKYYSGGWRTFGYTDDGSISKELLPKSYTFNLNYNYGSDDKVQNVGSDQIVVLTTGKVICNSGLCTHYYSGGWRTFSDGMQLMPGEYTFHFNDGTPNTVVSINAEKTINLDDYI